VFILRSSVLIHRMRFAYVHLIEETARHVGHIDILREFLDGTVGE